MSEPEAAQSTHPFACPHCGEQMVRATRDRLKAPTAIVVLHKSGAVEINCAHCKRGVFLPVVLSDGPFELKKAEPRFVIGLTPNEASRQE